jgi:hypothetical protein
MHSCHEHTYHYTNEQINLLSSFFIFPPLFKTTEGVVVGCQIFAWAPKKNKTNSGKHFFAPTLAPLGAIFKKLKI